MVLGSSDVGLLAIYLYLGRRHVKDYRMIFTIKAVSLIIINYQIKNIRSSKIHNPKSIDFGLFILDYESWFIIDYILY